MYIFPCNQRQSGSQESTILTASSQEGVTYSFVIRQFNNRWAPSWHLAEWHQQNHWTSDRQHFRIATRHRKANNSVIQRQKGRNLDSARLRKAIHSSPGWFYKDPNYKWDGNAHSESVLSRAFGTHGLHLSGQRILVQPSLFKDWPFLKDGNLFLTSEWVCHEVNTIVGKNKPEKTGLKSASYCHYKKTGRHVEDGREQKILITPTTCKLPFYLQLSKGHIAQRTTVTCLFILSPYYLTPRGCGLSWLWASIAPFHLIHATHGEEHRWLSWSSGYQDLRPAPPTFLGKYRLRT